MAHNNLMRYQKRKLPTHNGTLWVEVGRAAQGIFLLFFSIKQIAEFDIFWLLKQVQKKIISKREKRKKKEENNESRTLITRSADSARTLPLSLFASLLFSPSFLCAFIVLPYRVHWQLSTFLRCSRG